MRDLSQETIEKVQAGQAVTFEELKPLLRPEGIQNGVMQIDKELCTNCGLCIANCPFKCWEKGEDKVPRLKEGYACFSCFNCVAACPAKAVSIVSTYKVTDGYFETGFPPVKMPQEPKNAQGLPTDWTAVERTIIHRRSVRNFKESPVPEPLIRRVLEAGRFAPSAGNTQPWKFTVVTDKEFINQLEEASYQVSAGLYNLYINDETAMNFFGAVGGTLPAPICDWRVISGGFGCVARKELPIYLNAPCVIFLGAHNKLVGQELHIGISGQNMNLAAVSMGLGCCWSNFGAVVDLIPEIKARLGFDDQWRIITTLCLGFPKFKQEGPVPRFSRPVTWFRPGVNQPRVEE